MPDPITFAELLAHGVLPHVSPISARRRAAEALPRVMVEQLCARPSREEIRAWRHVFLEQHWPSLLKEQAGATGHGWPELIAAMAVVLELLCGTLPREVAEHLAAHPHLRPHFDELRAPWQSFALVVDHEARPVRLLVTASGRPGHDGELPSVPSVEQRDDIRWWIEGERPGGRSHTLLLALLALAQWGELRLPGSRPFAATGELASDGRTILRVESLIDKLHAWFDAEPGGLLVTPAPAPEEVHRLLRPFDRHAGATRKMRAFRELPLDRWLAAASLEELRVKLERWLSLEADVAELGLIAWDGRRLEPEALAAWRFEWVQADGAPSPERIGDDMILDACWQVVAGSPRGARPSGVVIYGEPGSGKSLLSRILERRFVSGPLGALGLAVRRSARELAGALQSAPEVSLPELLAGRAPDLRATLYRNLLAARRLFVIVDGLDEVPSHELAAIGRRLADHHAPFIATSRATRAGLDTFPSHLDLRIQPLQRHDGADLLQQLGRRDLAEQLRYGQFSSPLRQWRASDPVDALCRTPFHVSLLAQLVNAGEHLHDVDPAELYRRAFEALLEHAVGDERLTAEQADLLRRTLPSLAGAMALDWLRSPSGFLDDSAVTVRLEAAGLSGREGIAAQRALEFGYLLAPGAGNWEFSHRALAEWTAASALALNARRHLHRLEDSGISDPAAAERNALHFILAEGRPLHESRWWQLLELYAPRSIAPLVLVEALAGPQAIIRMKGGRGRPRMRAN
ncbi:MAG TPA: ATP-binding protein, partial [Sorangium sp.]|nr:ATP-binding protein [Sorangium sp.]